MFDCIIVGGRCAGASLALLLARKGYRVLCVEKAVFPRDKICTHMLWPPGVAALHRWGLWPQIADARPAICREMTTDLPGGRIVGPVHPVDGVDYTINLRRFKFDTILLEAAGSAGAEVRQGVVVEELLLDGSRVVGIRCRETKTGKGFEERARVVVGADGRHSWVAQRVGAAEYNVRPNLTANFFAYFEPNGERFERNEIVTRPPHELLLIPTDDGLVIASLFVAIGLVPQFGENLKREFYAAFDACPEIAGRLRSCRRVSPIRGALELTNLYRKPFGPGWALVGDASYAWDAIRAQGMNEAFLDAESLAETLDAVLSGRESFETAMPLHEQKRNRRTHCAYEVCTRAARFEIPAPRQVERLMAIFEGAPELIGAQRGLIAGSSSAEGFLARLHSHTSDRDVVAF